MLLVPGCGPAEGVEVPCGDSCPETTVQSPDSSEEIDASPPLSDGDQDASLVDGGTDIDTGDGVSLPAPDGLGADSGEAGLDACADMACPGAERCEDGQCRCGATGVGCSHGYVCQDAKETGNTQNPSWDFCWEAGTDTVLVPGGTFWMGCDELQSPKDVCQPDERPVHPVTAQGFAVQRTKVTVSAFAGCAEAQACEPASTCTWGEPNTAFDGKDDDPINCVTWQDARDYCDWWGAELGEPGRWSLCSEAQWELAARGSCATLAQSGDCAPQMRLAPWGDAEPTCGLAWMHDDASGGDGCGEGPVTTVADALPRSASVYGALQLVGNVWEWTQDCYYESYDFPAGNSRAPIDGTTWDDGHGGCGDAVVAGTNLTSSRVLRGGALDQEASHLRAADRFGYDAELAAYFLGFRCCRSLPAP